MNIHEIILEDSRIDEKPTSSIGNFAKKMASKVTTGGVSARLGGSAEMGSKANEIYKDLARWQGINSKNDKNMTAQDLAAFMKQHKLNAGGIDLPDGVLGKKTIDAVLKKASANALTGGNAAASTKAPAGAPASGGGVGGALGAMAKGAGVKTPNVKPSTGGGAGGAGGSGGGAGGAGGAGAPGPAGAPGAAGADGKDGKDGASASPSTSKPAGTPTAKDPKVTPLKNKGGISPEIQTMIDKLTPTEKKALVGAI